MISNKVFEFVDTKGTAEETDDVKVAYVLASTMAEAINKAKKAEVTVGSTTTIGVAHYDDILGATKGKQKVAVVNYNDGQDVLAPATTDDEYIALATDLTPGKEVNSISLLGEVTLVV